MILFDLLWTVGPAILAGVTVWRSSPTYKTVDTAPVPFTSPEPQHDVTRLVIELFRADEGWTESRLPLRRNVAKTTLTHETGVRVTETIGDSGFAGVYTTYDVEVASEAGIYELSAISSSDANLVGAEVKAFRTRQRDLKQRNLTRALAQRVAARERGEVLPVLGKSPLPGDDFPEVGSERAGISAVPAGLLLYDEQRQQVVKVGGEGSDRLALADSLRARYDLMTMGEAKHLVEKLRRDCMKPPEVQRIMQ